MTRREELRPALLRILSLKADHLTSFLPATTWPRKPKGIINFKETFRNTLFLDTVYRNSFSFLIFSLRKQIPIGVIIGHIKGPHAEHHTKGKVFATSDMLTDQLCFKSHWPSFFFCSIFLCLNLTKEEQS